MSNLNENSNYYTTGEMAKLCNVSVRTVQYYDTRNILIPINSIGELLEEEKPENVISILLAQQEQILKDEILERQSKLQALEELNRELKDVEHFSVESIGDIAYMMENKKNLRKVRGIALTVGIIMDIIEVVTLILWISKGIWWPFAIGMVFVILMGIWISWYYYKHVAYICPECHTVFRTGLKEMFFAPHTPKTRRLTCTKCGHKGFCVETYYDENGNVKV